MPVTLPPPPPTNSVLDRWMNLLWRKFSASGELDHNSGGGIQGGTTDEYYHLTSAEYTGSGTGVFARVTGATINPTSIGATTAGSGTFTSLASTQSANFTGNNGTAVNINGFGGASVQYAFNITAVGGQANTSMTGLTVSIGTPALSFTCPAVIGVVVKNLIQKGAGSTVTNQYGVLVEAQTFGTNNFGVATQVGAAANNWNIYASGTAKNYFNGTVLVGTTTDDGTNKLQVSGSASVTGDITGGDDLILPKTSGKGIKVDTTTPTFGWRDLLGAIAIRGVGAADPSYNVYRGGIRGYQFGASNEVFVEFHIPHDHVPASDIHIHAHWSTNGTTTAGASAGTITGGSVTWGFEVSYAKGHDQAAFSAPVTATLTQNASTTVYQHMIGETQLSATSPSASQIDSDDIEPDGVILVRAYLSANNITVASGLVPAPFLHYVDIHYQSTGMATKNKAPGFYT